MKNLFLLLSAILFLLSPKTYAQSFSDINTEAFENLIKPEERRPPGSPFTAGVSAAEDLTIEDLALSGIVMNRTDKYALISGYLIEVGDRIAGYKVETIEKGRVVLRRQEEVYVLTMGGM